MKSIFQPFQCPSYPDCSWKPRTVEFTPLRLRTCNKKHLILRSIGNDENRESKNIELDEQRKKELESGIRIGGDSRETSSKVMGKKSIKGMDGLTLRCPLPNLLTNTDVRKLTDSLSSQAGPINTTGKGKSLKLVRPVKRKEGKEAVSTDLTRPGSHTKTSPAEYNSNNVTDRVALRKPHAQKKAFETLGFVSRPTAPDFLCNKEEDTSQRHLEYTGLLRRPEAVATRIDSKLNKISRDHDGAHRKISERGDMKGEHKISAIHPNMPKKTIIGLGSVKLKALRPVGSPRVDLSEEDNVKRKSMEGLSRHPLRSEILAKQSIHVCSETDTGLDLPPPEKEFEEKTHMGDGPESDFEKILHSSIQLFPSDTSDKAEDVSNKKVHQSTFDYSKLQKLLHLPPCDKEFEEKTHMSDWPESDLGKILSDQVQSFPSDHSDGAEDVSDKKVHQSTLDDSKLQNLLHGILVNDLSAKQSIHVCSETDTGLDLPRREQEFEEKAHMSDGPESDLGKNLSDLAQSFPSDHSDGGEDVSDKKVHQSTLADSNLQNLLHGDSVNDISAKQSIHVCSETDMGLDLPPPEKEFEEKTHMSDGPESDVEEILHRLIQPFPSDHSDGAEDVSNKKVHQSTFDYSKLQKLILLPPREKEFEEKTHMSDWPESDLGKILPDLIQSFPSDHSDGAEDVSDKNVPQSTLNDSKLQNLLHGNSVNNLLARQSIHVCSKTDTGLGLLPHEKEFEEKTHMTDRPESDLEKLIAYMRQSFPSDHSDGAEDVLDKKVYQSTLEDSKLQDFLHEMVRQNRKIESSVQVSNQATDISQAVTEGEDCDWARAEISHSFGRFEEVELISCNNIGFIVAFGSLLGLLPYCYLSSRKRPFQFEVWLKKISGHWKFQKEVGSESSALFKNSISTQGLVHINNEAAIQCQEQESAVTAQESQILINCYNQDRQHFLSSFLGQKTRAAVTLVDRKHGTLIFSEMVKESQESIEKKESIMDKLNIGDIVTCKVTRIVSYGVFVELEGVNAFIHRLELSWDPDWDADSHLIVGEVLQAKVCGMNRFLHRINLSLKQLKPDPLVNGLLSILEDHGLKNSDLEYAEVNTQVISKSENTLV